MIRGQGRDNGNREKDREMDISDREDGWQRIGTKKEMKGYKERRDGGKERDRDKEESKPKKETLRRRLPVTAAVTITAKERKTNNGDRLRKAREKVSLEELGIKDTKIRMAANGGILIEVMGQEMDKLADKLANKLRDALEGEAVVKRPFKMGEMRFEELDMSVTKEEVKAIVIKKGKCKDTEVRVEEIRRFNGMGEVWVQCLLANALEISKKRRIKIG